jgi:hypothetical protein
VRNYRTMREHYLPAFELNEIIDDNLQIRTRNERSYSTDSVYLLCRRKFAEWNGLQDSILKMKELPCRVLERREGEGDGETTYVAEVVYFPGDTDVCESAVGVGILWNVTRDAFYFEDMPYGRDHHQPWTFRHEMHIPDEMFPEIWKTTTTTTTTTKKP